MHRKALDGGGDMPFPEIVLDHVMGDERAPIPLDTELHFEEISQHTEEGRSGGGSAFGRQGRS